MPTANTNVPKMGQLIALKDTQLKSGKYPKEETQQLVDPVLAVGVKSW